jgi:Domain of unknown function (DUF3841)
MKFWTIQTKEAWEKALDCGYLAGDPEYVEYEFLAAYQWMMRQMQIKLSNYSREYPIWVWLKRPDLRFSGHLEKGGNGVLLELDLDEKDVLVSDFQAWHIVLHDSFLALTEEEEQMYDSGKLDISLEESWLRIFNYQELMKHDYWKSEEEDLQGVTGLIPVNKIKLVKAFTAR